MLVRDLMQAEVATLGVQDTLGLADDIMRLGRIRHLPVVDGEERVVGIVSQRDLFRAAVSCMLGFSPTAEREWLARIVVRDVMTSDVKTVAPDLPVQEAVRIMLDQKLGCLPVVEHGRLAGLVSESDCMRYLARLLDLAQERQDLPETEE